MAFYLRNDDGSCVETPAGRFSHSIEGVKYWFAFHRVSGVLTVSDWKSGLRIAEVSSTLLAACLGNEHDAAKAALLNTLADKGAANIARAMTAAAEAAGVPAKGAADTTPRRAARRLNDHHAKYAAGFYPSAVCSRAFGARVRAGQLEITPDFESWVPVDLATVTFRDHNGRQIFV